MSFVCLPFWEIPRKSLDALAHTIHRSQPMGQGCTSAVWCVQDHIAQCCLTLSLLRLRPGNRSRTLPLITRTHPRTWRGQGRRTLRQRGAQWSSAEAGRNGSVSFLKGGILGVMCSPIGECPVLADEADARPSSMKLYERSSSCSAGRRAMVMGGAGGRCTHPLGAGLADIQGLQLGLGEQGCHCVSWGLVSEC